MIRTAPVTMLLAGAILFAPIASAMALSTEDAPTGPDSSAQIADPDEALDQFANPGGTAGAATIEVPPIVMPGAEPNDYLSPDEDDDPQLALPPSDDAPTGTAN